MSCNLSRRGFLSAGAPLLVPSTVLGAFAPANRVTVGMIGVGRQCVQVNLKQFLAMPDVQVVAVCDVDSWRLERAREQVERAYGKTGCKTYRDYKELLADKSIDAVMISTPDHWHVPMSIDALATGKDVSCEKPLTRSIGEGRRLVETVQKCRRVFRTDSEFRSIATYSMAAELVRNHCCTN
jgi:predicted dehydrogenase